MTELSFKQYTMPSASMGANNPLPDLWAIADAHASIDIDHDTITEDESRYMGWARVNGILPYTIQDGYNRARKPHTWRAAVLKNDYIEATFLPQLGGRLWSLVDLETGRELLHRNPVFQPCNLALRNAWISGGVEWNCGIIGHHPYTVSPMFTETIELPGGQPVLRMYQYERVRDLVYRIEATLPDDSRQLIVHVRIDNAGEKDTAVYWWSNMAVDETPDTRVIVPADRAYRYGYGKKLTKVPVPQYGELDASRPASLPQAMDFFFDIPDGQRRWITALDQDGYGLIQTSTDALQGRKLFVWGQGAGGKRWQTFLSEEGSAYLEIQAGLAHTQLEHLPLETGGRREWTEAYGSIKIDPTIAHGDWHTTISAIDAALEAKCPRTSIDELDSRLSDILPLTRGKLTMAGEGWAALETALRWGAFHPGGLHFPVSSIKDGMKDWLALIQQGALPQPDPLETPETYQVSDEWMERLAKSISSGKGDHWYSHYHMGVMLAHNKNTIEARAEFEKSMAQTPNPWAQRCLAVLDALAGDKQSAADKMLEALRLADAKPLRQLAIETLHALIDAGRFDDAERTAENLPPSIRALGRVKTLRSQALIRMNEADKAERLLRGKLELTDIREGELKLSELWTELCALKGIPVEEYPLPPQLDFRMH